MGFLNFLRESGKRFTSLKVMMNTDATDLIWSGDTVAGVNADTPEGPVEIRSELTIDVTVAIRSCGSAPISRSKRSGRR